MIGRDEMKVGLRSCQPCMLRLRSSWMWYRVMQWHPISGRDPNQGRGGSDVGSSWVLRRTL